MATKITEIREVLGPLDYLPCERCLAYRDEREIVCNFGLCDECFEENCPCNENRPNSCPLHFVPDVVLSFERLHD